MRFGPADLLTFSRLALTPFFVALFVIGMKLPAFVVFCVASFTDLIDGTVARLYGQSSKTGALLDPIADKFLMQSCFLLLLVSGYLPIWFYIMALARDIMIVSGILYLEMKKVVLPYRAIWPSKIATLSQMTVAVLALLRWWIPFSPSTAGNVLWWQMAVMIGTAVLIVVSGAQYVVMGIGILRRHSAKHETQSAD